MRQIDKLLSEYGESHQNATNKTLHWFCIPLIMFSLFGLLTSVPFPIDGSYWYNWGSVVMILTLIYYIRLSFMMFLGFVGIGFLMVWGNLQLGMVLGTQGLIITSVAIFAAAWIVQFVGHNIEGKKPSFIKDVQFLLIGPAWLLHFIFLKIGVKY